MTWNHRVVRVKETDNDDLLILTEVFYDENGKPTGYTEPFMCSETIDGLRELLARLSEALAEPVLDATEMKWEG